MFQQLLIGLFFIAAAVYLGQLAWRSWRSERACDSGCNKCGVDLDKIEADIKAKGKL